MQKTVLLLLCGLLTMTAAYAQAWSLSGNAISAGNFLGTTNAQSLQFKVNNSNAGQIDASYQNTFLGISSGGTISSTAAQNVAIGFSALTNNSSGLGNVALGRLALASNTSGGINTAVGVDAAYRTTTGGQNTAVGGLALYYNSTASNNGAFGLEALLNNTTGASNNAFGTYALYTNTTGANNTAMGHQALYSNTTATGNTAVGFQSSYSNTTGYANTTVGAYAMMNNTTGTDNVAVGYEALEGPGVGDGGTGNVAVGPYTMLGITSGTYNTASGYYAAYNTSSGSDNTAYGPYSLSTNTTGSYNTAFGYYADVNNGALTNTTVIGFGAYGTASNQVRIGNSLVTSIGGYANWSNISDGRFKKNVKENVPGLEFINQLRPVTYTLDVTGINKFLHPTPPTTREGKAVSLPDETAAIQQKEAVIHTGFIAQEVETVAKKLNYDFSGIDAPKNSNDLYGLRYSDFVVPLVKAVQELSSTGDSLKNAVSSLQSQINDIQQQINNLKNGSAAMNSSGASLQQNAPNPFTNNTTIAYYIPANAGATQLNITNNSGQVIKTLSVGDKGPGQVTLYGGELAAGVYFYSLIIDGKTVDTKKMILTK